MGHPFLSIPCTLLGVPRNPLWPLWPKMPKSVPCIPTAATMIRCLYTDFLQKGGQHCKSHLKHPCFHVFYLVPLSFFFPCCRPRPHSGVVFYTKNGSCVKKNSTQGRVLALRKLDVPYSRGHWCAVLWGGMRRGDPLWIPGSQWDQQKLSFTLYVAKMPQNVPKMSQNDSK